MFNLSGPAIESRAMTGFHPVLMEIISIHWISKHVPWDTSNPHIQAIQVVMILPPKCLLKPCTCLYFHHHPRLRHHHLQPCLQQSPFNWFLHLLLVHGCQSGPIPNANLIAQGICAKPCCSILFLRLKSELFIMVYRAPPEYPTFLSPHVSPLSLSLPLFTTVQPLVPSQVTPAFLWHGAFVTLSPFLTLSLANLSLSFRLPLEMLLL